MAALHLIASSPDTGAALQNCLRVARADDSVVFIGNGVYCAVAKAFARATRRITTAGWYALATDVSRRGLDESLGAAIAVIDDGTLVDLVTTHQPIVSWS